MTQKLVTLDLSDSKGAVLYTEKEKNCKFVFFVRMENPVCFYPSPDLNKLNWVPSTKRLGTSSHCYPCLSYLYTVKT